MTADLGALTGARGLTSTVVGALSPYAGLLTLQASLPIALGNALADLNNGQPSNVKIDYVLGTAEINGSIVNFTARQNIWGQSKIKLTCKGYCYGKIKESGSNWCAATYHPTWQ